MAKVAEMSHIYCLSIGRGNEAAVARRAAKKGSAGRWAWRGQTLDGACGQTAIEARKALGSLSGMRDAGERSSVQGTVICCLLVGLIRLATFFVRHGSRIWF